MNKHKKTHAFLIVGFSLLSVFLLSIYFSYFQTDKFFLLEFATNKPIAHTKVQVKFGEYCEGSDYNDPLKRFVDDCGPDILFDGMTNSDGSINISKRYISKINNSYGANGGPNMSFLSEITIDGYSRLINKALLGNEFNNGKNYTYFIRDIDQTKVSAQIPSTVLIAVDENGWNIFNDGMIEFHYPTKTSDESSWILESCNAYSDPEPSCYLLRNQTKGEGSLSFSIEKNPEKVDARTWISQQPNSADYKDVHEVSYNGQKAVAYTLVEFDGQVKSKYILFSNSDIFVVVYDNLISQLPITEQVLSTFKFIK